MSALCHKRTYAAQQSTAVYLCCEFSPAVHEGCKADNRYIPRLPSWLVHYLFFSAKKVQEVSVDLFVLDRAKLEPSFTSDVSLLAPAKE
jgi:hypothetical protein